MNAGWVHCIGLGGIGVSAVAKFYLAKGYRVTGSDPVPSPVIDDAIEHGAEYLGPARADHITSDMTCIVRTDACRPDNPELQAAHRLNRPVKTFAVALGEIMAPFTQRVCISGTNGKSTTTALTGLLFTKAGLDPTVFVGSRVTAFNGNLRLGGTTTFVAEADEWRDHFHALAPTTLVITNVELDHPDYFQSVEQLVKSFQVMVDKLPRDGRLILNGDDPACARWAADPRAMTVGTGASAQLRYRVTRSGPEYQTFELRWAKQALGTFTLFVPGPHNVSNVALAIATALATGAKTADIQPTLDSFRGIWRRFEVLRNDTVTVVNDYAHHPTAIRVTLAGARAFYPGRRLIAVFQPHHHHRLTALFDDFSSAFADADEVVLVDVYAVTGRENVVGMKSGRDLFTAVASRRSNVSFYPKAEDVLRHLRQSVRPGDVVIIMGAGDVWTVGPQAAKELLP